MTRKRKLRQRRLALPFDVPLHPVDHDRGRAMLANIIETLSRKFAENSSRLQAGTPYNHEQ